MDTHRPCQFDAPLQSPKFWLQRFTSDFYPSISLQNSGNGVFLNDRKIAPRVPHPLQNRDLIEIGRDARCDQVAPYRFRYYVKAIILVKEEKKEAEAPALCTCEAAPSPMTHMKMKLSEQEQRLKSEFSAKQKEFEDKLEELQKLVLEKEKENNLNQDNAVKSEGDKDQQEDQVFLNCFSPGWKLHL